MIILDMDGVIVDFVEGWRRLNGFQDHPINEIYDMCSWYKTDANKFWRNIDADWWANLPKTPEADELVEIILSRVPPTLICVTSMGPVPGGEAGKVRWLQKHYPNLSHNVMFGNARHFFAGPDTLLIDDCENNVSTFQLCGGQTLLFPRPWNYGPENWADQLRSLLNVR